MVTSTLNQNFPVVNQPFVDEQRNILPAWLYLLQALWRRTGNAPGVNTEVVAAEAATAQTTSAAALVVAQNADTTATSAQSTANSALSLASSALQSGDAVGGWVDPTGTGSRATFNMDWTQSVSSPPTQAEVQAIVTQVSVLSKRLGQLELDLKTVGAIKT